MEQVRCQAFIDESRGAMQEVADLKLAIARQDAALKEVGSVTRCCSSCIMRRVPLEVLCRVVAVAQLKLERDSLDFARRQLQIQLDAALSDSQGTGRGYTNRRSSISMPSGKEAAKEATKESANDGKPAAPNSPAVSTSGAGLPVTTASAGAPTPMTPPVVPAAAQSSSGLRGRRAGDSTAAAPHRTTPTVCCCK